MERQAEPIDQVSADILHSEVNMDEFSPKSVQKIANLEPLTV